jgi:hypothetical protein
MFYSILVEVEHTTSPLDLGFGAEVSTGASDDILAVGINDGGIERVIGCPLTTSQWRQLSSRGQVAL